MIPAPTTDRNRDTTLAERGARVRAPVWRSYVITVALCAVATLIAWPLSRWLDQANIVMLFLLTVVVTATRLGRRPAVLAAFLCVALFDFFFVQPQFSFAVNDVQYLVTFAVMLVVALTIGHLTTSLQLRHDEAQRQAAEQSALYALAARLSGALTREHCVATTAEFIARQAGARITVLQPDAHERLAVLPGSAGTLSETELAAAQAVHASANVVDARDLGHDDAERMMLPLIGATRRRGVLIIAADPKAPPLSDQQSLLSAVATLLTTALERLHYVEVARQSDLEVQSERLRSGILAALSHDVRTPLTAMYGLADSLAIDLGERDAVARETALTLRDQAMQLNGMVTNLLDMARFKAGKLSLRREWQPFDEVLGASIRFCASALRQRPLLTELDDDLPLVEIDAVLIERVLCNLIENAAKYSPPGTPVRISVSKSPESLVVAVSDSGSGFPAARLDSLFDLFARGENEGLVAGMGVGLAICRAIVEAHGGTIQASNTATGGACVNFSLPLGTPPEIDLAASPESWS